MKVLRSYLSFVMVRRRWDGRHYSRLEGEKAWLKFRVRKRGVGSRGVSMAL